MTENQQNQYEELVKAEANFLRSLAEQLVRRADQLNELLVVVKKEDTDEKLASLPWKRAQSGKCDWVKGEVVPQAIKSLLGEKGYSSGQYYYLMTKDGNILRFPRREEATTK